MQSALLILSCRLYGLMLAAYPEEFRQTFGAEMAQVFRAGCRDALHERGIIGLAAYWLHILGDWSLSVGRERWTAMDRRTAALLLLALMVGIWIGLVDFRSNEVQNAVLLLAVSGILFGFARPAGAWRWAVLLGLGVPIVHYAAFWLGMRPPYPVQPGIYACFLALLPAFICVYLGVGVRFVFSSLSEA